MSDIAVLSEQIRVLQENQAKLFTFMEHAMKALARIEAKLEQVEKPGMGASCIRQDARISELEKQTKEIQATIWKWAGGMGAAAFILSWMVKK